MGRKFLLAVAFAVVMAAPAFASVQNIKVSGDIDTTGVIRNNFDLGANVASDRNQQVVITQTRLRVDADLTDNVAATVALINEREWNEEDTSDNDIDLNLAFVQLREMLYSPLTVYVGRQHLNYGNAFIIGAGGPNNSAAGALATVAADLTKRSAMDAVRAVFDYNPLTIDVFAALVDENTTTGVDIDDDVNLYGINANMQLGDEMNTIVEGYFFVKHSDAAESVGTAGLKSDVIYVPGLRASTNPISGLNLQAEVAWQRGRITDPNGDGSVDNIDREAMAGQLIANYAVPVSEQYNPMLTAVYTYTSGDKNVTNNNPLNTASTPQRTPASGETYTAWDPMYEDQSGGTIYNSLFNLTNSHIVVLSGQVTPLEDVTTKLSWTGLWLDKDVQGGTMTLVQPDVVAGQSVNVSSSENEIGQEVDLDITYAYTEDVEFGLNLGYFFTGDLFGKATSGPISDDNASQALANVAVAF